MLINEVISVTEKDQSFNTGLLAKVQDIITVAMNRDIKKISTKKEKKSHKAKTICNKTINQFNFASSKTPGSDT